jgi:hypothetical protein
MLILYPNLQVSVQKNIMDQYDSKQEKSGQYSKTPNKAAAQLAVITFSDGQFPTLTVEVVFAQDAFFSIFRQVIFQLIRDSMILPLFTLETF